MAVVLEHSPRHVAGERQDRLVGSLTLAQLCDRAVSQIMEAETYERRDRFLALAFIGNVLRRATRRRFNE